MCKICTYHFQAAEKDVIVKVVIKRAQSHACMSYAEPTHEARAE